MKLIQVVKLVTYNDNCNPAKLYQQFYSRRVTHIP